MVVTLENTTAQSKSLLQVQDLVPAGLGGQQTCAIATLPQKSQHTWRYEIPTERRGIYTWPEVRLRTGGPSWFVLVQPSTPCQSQSYCLSTNSTPDALSGD